ncbi:hypothetical protein [Oceaniglobus trochenteri]|nr:hypothetical protein [Oceaniglobus trochenteri]
MKKTGLILLVGLFGLSACNTAVGVGKDVYGGTKYIAKKAIGSDEDKDV